MSICLSRLVAPTAAVFVAFGLCFGILSHDAFAERDVPHRAPSPLVSAPLISSLPTAPSEKRATFAELKADLDQTDRVAILEAIHVGLSDAPDGATYMWRRHNGKLAGSVRPTASFKDATGRVCRFLVFQLLLGEHMRQVEGIGCRQDDKSWLLEG